MVPAVLRAVQRSSKGVEKGKTVTHRFIVPVLDAPGITIGQLVDGATHDAALLGDGQPERPRPPTAEERVAARRAQVEARTTSAGEAVAVPVASAPATSPEPEVFEGEVITEAPAAQPVQCAAMSPYEPPTRCAREDGHPGLHRNHAKESWS